MLLLVHEFTWFKVFLLQPPPRRDEVLVIVGNAVYTKGQNDVSVGPQ